MTARLRLRRTDGRVYLERWGIEHARIGGVFVHKMTAPDPGMDLHDHPWTFWSFILAGGYTESRNLGLGELYRMRPIGDDRFRWTWRKFSRDECHRITFLHAKRSWSLVIHGPRRQEWGFYTNAGWVKWDEYDDEARGLTTDEFA
jgi:hypothetical protein